MIEYRGGFDFALKVAESLRAFGHLVRQELERNKAAGLDVLAL
jgi:hypothetical protein